VKFEILAWSINKAPNKRHSLWVCNCWSTWANPRLFKLQSATWWVWDYVRHVTAIKCQDDPRRRAEVCVCVWLDEIWARLMVWLLSPPPPFTPHLAWSRWQALVPLSICVCAWACVFVWLINAHRLSNILRGNENQEKLFFDNVLWKFAKRLKESISCLLWIGRFWSCVYGCL